MAPSNDDRTGVPRLVPSCDVGKLEIGALEKFVLSNVDGARSERDIADLTGLSEGELAAILDRLTTLGAVERVGLAGTGQARPLSATKIIASAAAAAPAGAASSPMQKTAAAAAIPDDQVELDEAMKMRVLELSSRLDDVDHYQLLGIPRDAEKKAIKGAYYGIAAKFHTDRYFGKNLGRFKALMEQIFTKATTAHDALSNKTRKAEYDQYLVDRDRTQAYEKLLAAVDDGADFFEAERTSGRLAAAAPITELVGKTAPVVVPVEPPKSPPVVVRAPEPARPPVDTLPQGPITPLTAEQERARREALARRLAGQRAGIATGRQRSITLNNPGAASSGRMRSTPPAPTEDEVRAATDSIKRAYEDRRDGAKRAQAAKFIEAGAAALAKEDFVAAATQYRLATKYTDDPEIHAIYADVNRRARDLMCDAYLKQARYEEQQQKWHEAANSYVKAAEGRPDDADIAERAAAMLLREGRDLRRAGKYAELAVQKNPNNAAFRVTLANVYLGAGLFLRAKSELEQALKLAPGDAKVKELLAHAKKMVS